MSALSASSAARLAKVLPSLNEISLSQLTTKPALPTYNISRTSSGNLPVYKTIRSQCEYTDIKRVKGNVVQLRNDLQNALPQIEKSKFTCFIKSNSIHIKGNYVDEIKKVLETKF